MAVARLARETSCRVNARRGDIVLRVPEDGFLDVKRHYVPFFNAPFHRGLTIRLREIHTRIVTKFFIAAESSAAFAVEEAVVGGSTDGGTF